MSTQGTLSVAVESTEQPEQLKEKGETPLAPLLNITLSPTAGSLAQQGQRLEGVVSRTVDQKFGFIKPSTAAAASPSLREEDIFFHYSELSAPARNGVKPGCSVAFTVVNNPWEEGKLKATEIVVTGGGCDKEGGESPESFKEMFGSWRELFLMLSKQVSDPPTAEATPEPVTTETRTAALGKFVHAIRLAAREDGVNLLRSMRHAWRLGLVGKDQESTERCQAVVSFFNEFVCSRNRLWLFTMLECILAGEHG